MTGNSDIEVEQELDCLIGTLAPFLSDSMQAGLRDGLQSWRQLIVARERLRICRVLNAAIDLDLISDGIDFSCRTNLPAKDAIAAMSARAAAKPCGRPS